MISGSVDGGWMDNGFRASPSIHPSIYSSIHPLIIHMHPTIHPHRCITHDKQVLNVIKMYTNIWQFIQIYKRTYTSKTASVRTSLIGIPLCVRSTPIYRSIPISIYTYIWILLCTPMCRNAHIYMWFVNFRTLCERCRSLFVATWSVRCILH